MVPIRPAGLIALALLAALVPLRAADPVSPSDLVQHEKGFGALQAGTKTFTATIKQTLNLQGIAQPIVSQGTLDYATPDRLLIRFSQPAGEWMLINGNQVAVQKKDKPLDVHDNSSPDKKSSHTASLLDFFRSGPDHWHQSFDVSMNREGDHLLVHLKPWMTPTSTFQGVDAITTTLQLPGYELLSMEIAMHGSNQIRYDFSGIHRNAPLDPALFTIPKP